MGYYTGDGVTTSGGSSVSVLMQFLWYGGHNVYQQITSTTVTKPGISLADAKAAESSADLQTVQLWDAAHSVYCWATNCKGTRKQVSYSQIGESNLYELTETTEVIKAKLDDGGWQS